MDFREKWRDVMDFFVVYYKFKKDLLFFTFLGLMAYPINPNSSSYYWKQNGYFMCSRWNNSDHLYQEFYSKLNNCMTWLVSESVCIIMLLIDLFWIWLSWCLIIGPDVLKLLQVGITAKVKNVTGNYAHFSIFFGTYVPIT